MTLTPTFNKEVFEYSATTTNASNTITATPEKAGATVAITCGEDEYESGDPIAWEIGENEVIITVTNGDDVQEYTVIVTKDGDVSE